MYTWYLSVTAPKAFEALIRTSPHTSSALLTSYKISFRRERERDGGAGGGKEGGGEGKTVEKRRKHGKNAG